MAGKDQMSAAVPDLGDEIRLFRAVFGVGRADARRDSGGMLKRQRHLLQLIVKQVVHILAGLEIRHAAGCDSRQDQGRQHPRKQPAPDGVHGDFGTM